MDAPDAAPRWLAVYTAAERPDLWAHADSDETFDGLWPEYNLHGNRAGYFNQLVPRFAHLQAIFVDRRSHDLVARARTIPFWWDGTLEDLPQGIDAAGHRAVSDSRSPTTLSALAAEVRPAYQRSGLSAVVLAAMVALARREGLAPLVAPVRPSWKDRFPLHSIGDYVTWQRRDGLPFDPWLRVHVRMGARMLRPEPRSMEFSAPVSNWEKWTGLPIHGDGRFVFPGGLAPLIVTDQVGRYWEPNVWMLHEVA